MKELSVGDALVLAQGDCTHCGGLGTSLDGRGGLKTIPCNCVWRAIFRACYARFRECAQSDQYISKVRFNERPPGPASLQGAHAPSYERPNEEYMADFVLIARRTLRGNKRQLDLFRYHFLLGASWRPCAERLGIDRGEFFHEVYRVQQKLGRAFCECEPYALFPPGQYFARSTRQSTSTTTPVAPVRPPLKKSAA